MKSIIQKVDEIMYPKKPGFSSWTKKDIYDKSTEVGDTSKALKAIDKKRKYSTTNPQSERYSLKWNDNDKDGFSDATQLYTKDQLKQAKADDNGIDEKGVNVHGVNSTAVDVINYDPNTKDLGITFHGGSKNYIYPDVPAQTLVDFINAPSKGKYVNQVIRPNYSTNQK